MSSAILTADDLVNIKHTVLTLERQEIARNVDPSRFFGHLRAKYVFDERDCDEIRAVSSRVGSAEVFVDTLKRKGGRGYDEFCNALMNDKTQMFLLQRLTQTLELLRAKVIERKTEKSLRTEQTRFLNAQSMPPGHCFHQPPGVHAAMGGAAIPLSYTQGYHPPMSQYNHSKTLPAAYRHGGGIKLTDSQSAATSMSFNGSLPQPSATGVNGSHAVSPILPQHNSYPAMLQQHSESSVTGTQQQSLHSPSHKPLRKIQSRQTDTPVSSLQTYDEVLSNGGSFQRPPPSVNPPQPQFPTMQMPPGALQQQAFVNAPTVSSQLPNTPQYTWTRPPPSFAPQSQQYVHNPHQLGGNGGKQYATLPLHFTGQSNVMPPTQSPEYNWQQQMNTFPGVFSRGVGLQDLSDNDSHAIGRDGPESEQPCGQVILARGQ